MTGIDTGRIAAAVAELLEAIGEDPQRDGLRHTPQRVADSYREYFAGIGVDPLRHLDDLLPVEEPGELVVVRDLEFRSTCEHHLVPFTGTAHIAYAPEASLVGLGRLAQVVETLAARPQLQERLTDQVAGTIDAGLAPRGVLVVLDATHSCLAARGARQAHSTTATMAARGIMTDAVNRAEALALIGAHRG
ncbi:GTP cyclohydrolase I FolE [Marisediminicola senii]|uniref:GTP cyclohydrolase I FolE n=1 Tax=Marisediminicola senii TaxID=2711233 RepID=UPI0013EC19C2|nr:GTP cyclohydrolase I FolE [Marisediminicola senii]